MEPLFDKNFELSTSFQPDADNIDFALNNKIDERAQRDKFIEYYRAKGQGSSNWNIVYRRWLHNCLNYKQSRNNIGKGASNIPSAYELLMRDDPNAMPAIAHPAECDHYLHPDYKDLPKCPHGHPIWPTGPEITPMSRTFNKSLYNARRLYLLTIPDGKESGLNKIDMYDRTRFIYEVTNGEDTRHYQPSLEVLGRIVI